ncbi:MAG TPA: GtrA family protein [Porphyromonadaceae bacterium]|jgi:putative flippase GtrA|uniref:GtrA family protein n=1 Tax=Limibacterium fermenti TaxID=3229863 RepID=UPI000E95862B|nr:GtrA family protein [Porphyromonadaceae bacterium]HBL34080.1 GtrA family protein [Porphyromonadaceae bacterium]HBX21464.1 GtrA family protein [Porphyromonadaceae bacterium]HBX45487.1 GtrA family protein [Porphyromonadaceae bacterium]HCM19506.1 GtrA family protein [Porphyromonadaceae bacterium]
MRNSKLLHKLLHEPSDNVFIQLFRYGFVGGTAFVVDFSVLYVLTRFAGLYYLLSAAIAFIIGLAVNYLLSISWVFNRRKVNNRFSELFIFTVIGIVGLLLTSLLMWLFTEQAGLFYLISKIITTAIVLIWNFTARKLILF